MDDQRQGRCSCKMAPTEVDAIQKPKKRKLLRAIADSGIAAVRENLTATRFRRTSTQTPQFGSDPSFAPLFFHFNNIRHHTLPFMA